MREYKPPQREREPKAKEPKKLKEIKEDPKGFIRDSLIRHFQIMLGDISVEELEKMKEKGSKERLKVIGVSTPDLNSLIAIWEHNTGEELHASFKTATDQSALLGDALDQYIDLRIRERQAAEDKKREVEAKKYRGEWERKKFPGTS
jgi:hypothetical protein